MKSRFHEEFVRTFSKRVPPLILGHFLRYGPPLLHGSQMEIELF